MAHATPEEEATLNEILQTLEAQLVEVLFFHNFYFIETHHHTITIDTVYKLLRTYNVTGVKYYFRYFPFFVQTCFHFTAFTLLTTPEIRLLAIQREHYLHYTLT